MAQTSRSGGRGRPESPTPRPVKPEDRQDPQLSRPPEYKAHFGRVQAAVWRRDVDGRATYSVTVTRSYKDKYDQWQRTSSLDEDDLLYAAEALRDASAWIQRQRHQTREGALEDLRVPRAPN